jgi:protein-arginine kinase activator protein McsA
MAEAGILMEEKQEAAGEKEIGIEGEEERVSEYGDYSVKELEEMLQKAIDSEDYERASEIRDEISKRKK